MFVLFTIQRYHFAHLCINVLIFQMETGAFGVLGHLVVPHVEVEPRPELEFVTLRLHYMEVPIV